MSRDSCGQDRSTLFIGVEEVLAKAANSGTYTHQDVARLCEGVRRAIAAELLQQQGLGYVEAELSWLVAPGASATPDDGYRVAATLVRRPGQWPVVVEQSTWDAIEEL